MGGRWEGGHQRLAQRLYGAVDDAASLGTTYEPVRRLRRLQMRRAVSSAASFLVLLWSNCLGGSRHRGKVAQVLTWPRCLSTTLGLFSLLLIYSIGCKHLSLLTIDIVPSTIYDL